MKRWIKTVCAHNGTSEKNEMDRTAWEFVEGEKDEERKSKQKNAFNQMHRHMQRKSTALKEKTSR